MNKRSQIILLFIVASIEMWIIHKGYSLAAMWGIGGYAMIRGLWLNHKDREEKEKELKDSIRETFDDEKTIL